MKKIKKAVTIHGARITDVRDFWESNHGAFSLKGDYMEFDADGVETNLPDRVIRDILKEVGANSFTVSTPKATRVVHV